MALFISDLHLSPSADHLLNLFEYFCREIAKGEDQLYILGDLFAMWPGDDYSDKAADLVQQELRYLAQAGTEIFIMGGNRDFLLGKQFAKACQAQALQDPTTIDLYGTRTLLLHGDNINPDETSYLRYRSIIQHPLTKWLGQCFPVSWRSGLAKRLRAHSDSKKTYWDPNFEPDQAKALATVSSKMQQQNATQCIYGHIHHPIIQHYQLNGQQLARYVLADWHEQGNYLACDASGEYRLNYFDLNKAKQG